MGQFTLIIWLLCNNNNILTTKGRTIVQITLHLLTFWLKHYIVCDGIFSSIEHRSVQTTASCSVDSHTTRWVEHKWMWCLWVGPYYTMWSTANNYICTQITKIIEHFWSQFTFFVSGYTYAHIYIYIHTHTLLDHMIHWPFLLLRVTVEYR